MNNDAPGQTGAELLDRDRIIASLDPASRGLLAELDLRQEIDSTNAEAMRRVQSGAGSGYVCTAEQQTAGRGRRGRGWVSPFASNLYLSCVWEFEGGMAVVEGLSLAVGVAVANALSDCGVHGVQLKWPNDVLFRGKKLGGILVELSGASAQGCKAVVGIGLNVTMPAAASASIDQSWTDIASIVDPAPGRNHLLAALLNSLLPLMSSFETHGFAAWAPLWSAIDAYAGQPVIVHRGDHQLAGTVSGISEQGALLLDVGGTVQTIVGGEVSLRPAS